MDADALGDTPQYITSPQIVTVNSPGFTPLLIAPASRIQGFQEGPENFASFTYRKPGMKVVGWQMLPLNNPGEIALASQKTFLIVRVGGFDGFNLAVADTDGNPLEDGVGFVLLVDDTDPFDQKVIVNTVGNKDGLLQIFNEDGSLAASIYLQVFARRTVLIQHHTLQDDPPAIGRSYLKPNEVSPSCESLLNQIWSSQANIEFKLTGDTDTILVDAAAKVVPLKPKPRTLRRDETEFLPAALEIIETPASPVGRAIGGTIIAFAAIAVGWACIGEVDIIATAQGRIIPTGKSKVIQPFDTGVVRRIAVADGSLVRKGDVLVELDPTTDTSDETRLAFALAQDRLDLARLRALLADAAFAPPGDADPRMSEMASRQLTEQAAEHRAKLDNLDKQIAQKQAEGREIRAAIEKIEMTLPLLTEQRDIRSSLLQNQYGSRLTYLQTQQQVVEAQHELEAQKQKQDEIVQALAGLDRQQAEVRAEFRKGLLTDQAKAEVAANEHGEDLRKAVMKRNLRTLRAPVDGTVQQLAVHTLGGIVTPAQQLMVVVPKGTGIEIDAVLPNKDVGFVHKGQPAEIKVETFNFTRYGLLHGTVMNLSQDVVAPQDAEQRNSRKETEAANDEQARQAGQPTYVALISLYAKTIRTEDGDAQLEPGMAVTTEIKTGRRTVMSYLLSPLQRLKQEGLRER